MQARANRTVICSVVFLDIVEYSRKPVAEQIRAKERLNELLSKALADVAVNDRIILDTGDGAALSFLGDPEDALFVSLSLRDALLGPQPPDATELPLRIGINLGPVKLITDINGRPNIIGDGINVAQRIMGFSSPGQILVSRSYYDVVSCLSDGYDRLFKYEGARTDKHVREHEVYAVALGQQPPRRIGERPDRAAMAPAAVLDRLKDTVSGTRRKLYRAPRLATLVAVIAVLAAALLIRLSLPPRASQPVAEAQGTETPVTAASPEPLKPAVPREKTAPVVEAQPAPPPKSATRTETRPAPAQPKPAAPQETKPAPPPAVVAAPVEPAAAEPATVTFAISPWGEVYVNDRMHGVAPPLREVKLPPGRHKIEIRNADFTPHVQVIEAQAGTKVRIRHKFR